LNVPRCQVLEENLGGLVQSTFCGDATVPVDALLSGARTISPGLMQTQPQPIPLHKRGENTGQSLGGGLRWQWISVSSSIFEMEI